MSTNAFTKLGNTVVFTASTSAPTPVQAVSSSLGGNQYRILNTSSNVVVFLGFGSTSAQATTNAVVVSSSQNSIPLLPGTDEILERLFRMLTSRALRLAERLLCTSHLAMGCKSC